MLAGNTVTIRYVHILACIYLLEYLYFMLQACRPGVAGLFDKRLLVNNLGGMLFCAELQHLQSSLSDEDLIYKFSPTLKLNQGRGRLHKE